MYKAEEVERGKIENSQRPVKSGPLLPLLTCGTSSPLPREMRHQRLHALAPACRTWAGNAAMIRWSEIWENRELRRVGRLVWSHIYGDQAGESKRVGSLDVDAQRSGSLETLNPLRFQGETVVLVSAACSVNSHYGDINCWVSRKIKMTDYRLLSFVFSIATMF